MKSNLLNIDLVAFDAGGAELLSSMVQHESNMYNWRLITPENSPARVIFERKNLSNLITNSNDIKQICSLWDKLKPDYLFCGTGCNGYELSFIREAKRREIISIGFPDHWINYRERFGYPESNWEDNKPDYFAMSDNRAYHLAGELKLGQLLQIKNYYIADLISEFNKYKLDNPKNKSLLFISEAIEEHCLIKYKNPNYERYTQTQVLTEILDNFKTVAKKLKIDNIIIRLHPAESPDKYDYLHSRYPNIDISLEKPFKKALNESIAKAQVVIGIKSMALLIAFLLNKPVVSYIPINLQCCLPLPRICCINNLDDIPEYDKIPYFKADNNLSFYDEFPLDKMLSVLKRRRLNHAAV